MSFFPWTEPHFKPQRGSLALEREEEKAKALDKERKAKAAARRFQPRCRWPEPHTCRFSLECAHIKDASLGGEMVAENLVRFCAWIHRRGPESIHGKQLKVEAETARGSRGPLSFWRQLLDGSGYYLVARETEPYVIERD